VDYADRDLSAVSTRNAVQQAFDQFGGDAGLHKKSGAWYGHGEEVIAVLDLQKSQYGAQYYLNQAFWLRELGDERYPKEWKCHVRERVGSLLPAHAALLERLLDLEHEIPDEERFDELVSLLREELLPLIERGSSVVGLQAMLADGTLEGAFLRGPAQRVLGAGNSRP